MEEAAAWLKDGHAVQIICEASPWLPPEAPKADYLMQRSFAARSGSLSLRVAVTLVANIAGDCPNLLADLRCGIYERRPLICRIYPAETNPFVRLDPQKKSCPPEAWTSEQPLLQRNDSLVSEEIRNDIRLWRESNTRDIGSKAAICAALNLDTASIAREGFFIFSPRSAELLEVMLQLADSDASAGETQWRLVSDREETLDRLAQAGANAFHPRNVKAGPYEFIGFER